MFEYLTLLLPFLLLGFIAAGLSRISGVALSMIIVPTLLIWGATPLDVVAFMLLFVVYNNFTSETQDVRLDYKDLVLFPKWRLLIPLVLTVVGIFINPAIGIAVFMACFVLELLATVFKRIPERERPAVHVGPTISGDYYFGLVGLAILVITGFAWYAGRNRNAFKGIWEFIWVDFGILLGLFGIESSNYPSGLTRDYKSSMDRMLPMITVVGGYAGLMVIFGVYGMFSLPSFITAIGAAIGIRMFGLYEFPKRGTFSYLAIGFAIAAVVCLYLVSPVPTGFDAVNTIMTQPMVQ